MKRGHLELLRPVCPICRVGRKVEAELEIATVAREAGDEVLEGTLQCPEAECHREYPVIDGIPLILASIREYVSSNLFDIWGRDDLSLTTESLIGDCCGPTSPFDVRRRHLSGYVDSQYGDSDPFVARFGEPSLPRGSSIDLLEKVLEAAGGEPPAGPVVDLGCAVGGTTFALARELGRPTLGIDVNFSLLQFAGRILRDGVASYPQRRVGLVYDRREVRCESEGRELVDFWACDAGALPFRRATFAFAVSLNLLDGVTSPRDSLASLARVLKPGARIALTSPYDWVSSATPPEAWLGGHSQRGPHRGAAEPVLQGLFGQGEHPGAIEGLRLVAEEESLPWRVRMHDRSALEYRVHLAVAEVIGEPAA